MTLLMESNLVDGEEAATIDSEYVHASCLVTSGTDSMSFEAGENLLRRAASGCYSGVFLCRCFRGILMCSHARNPLEDVIIRGQACSAQISAGFVALRVFLASLPREIFQSEQYIDRPTFAQDARPHKKKHFEAHT